MMHIYTHVNLDKPPQNVDVAFWLEIQRWSYKFEGEVLQQANKKKRNNKQSKEVTIGLRDYRYQT